MRLSTLFKKCLEAEYRHEEHDASWSYERSAETLLLLFQHSNGSTDWINNLNFGAQPYHDMDPPWACHAGFLKVWNSVKPHVSPLILDESISQITIVGYSHGAALATLCHEYIWYHRPDLRARLFGFGFGCPRVLFGCVAPDIALRWDHFYVVRNENDVVTHLPPRAFGFCHVGNLVSIGKRGLYSPVDAHRPEHYLAELEKIEKT